MSAFVLDTWRYSVSRDTSVIVIPDGCRDIIFRSRPDRPTEVFLSPMPEGTNTVSVSKGVEMVGFRLRPGTVVDQVRLLGVLRENSNDLLFQDPAGVTPLLGTVLEEWCSLPPDLEDALRELEKPFATVKGVAHRLQIPVRRLQRLVRGATGRSPYYWAQLARVRRAARLVSSHVSLAEAACEFGYADQAHMTRAFRKWLSITPSRLNRASPQAVQLLQSGYG